MRTSRFVRNRGIVGACLGLFALFAGATSAQAGEVQTQKDVVFGTVGDLKLLLDVYAPTDKSVRHPGLILVHGGGWMGGDKQYYEKVGHDMAAKGYVAFSVNYRFAPTYHFPAQLDDVQRAVRWVRAHADKYDVDPNRLGALGDSAGGHLVAFLGTRDTRDNSDKELSAYSSRVQCVVDYYGPTDFTLSKTSPGVSAQALQILTAFFGKTAEQDPKLYRDGSPLVFVNSHSAPFLILHGDADLLVPVDQSRRLYEKLKKNHVEAEFVIMEKDGHGFMRPENVRKAQQLSEAFFDRHLNP